MNKIKKFHNERIKWLWILTLAYIVMLLVIVFVYKNDKEIVEFSSIIDLIIKRRVVNDFGVETFGHVWGKKPGWTTAMSLEATRIGVAFGFGFVLALIVDYVLISKITFIVINKIKPRKQV